MTVDTFFLLIFAIQKILEIYYSLEKDWASVVVNCSEF